MLASSLFYMSESLTRRATKYLISFAVGVILSVAFLDLLPESFQGQDINRQMLFVVAGLLLFFLIEKTLLWYHCHDNDSCQIHTFGAMSLVGDAIHNFADGIIIAIAFLVNPSVGVATALAIAFHEVPQEISDFGILIHSGIKRGRASAYNFLVAMSAPVGALLTYMFYEKIVDSLPGLLAVAAGGLIYIAVADLIPQLHKTTGFKQSVSQVVLLLTGLAIGIYII